MKGGSILGWRTVAGVGVKAAWRTHAGVVRSPGVERPSSVGISRSRVEALGAAGRTTWTPVVGLADETSARRSLGGVSLVRSSRQQPETTECPGGDDQPQGGELHLWRHREERTLEVVTC
jgi:hypothetical protein